MGEMTAEPDPSSDQKLPLPVGARVLIMLATFSFGFCLTSVPVSISQTYFIHVVVAIFLQALKFYESLLNGPYYVR